jgi:hypothetical protein
MSRFKVGDIVISTQHTASPLQENLVPSEVTSVHVPFAIVGVLYELRIAFGPNLNKTWNAYSVMGDVDWLRLYIPTHLTSKKRTGLRY